MIVLAVSADGILTLFFIGSIKSGLSAATLLLLSGDILGASGLVSSTFLSPRQALSDPSMTWKLVFLSTFLLISNTVLGAYFTDDQRLGKDAGLPVVSTYGYLLGGAFVGFGTKLGNGCTTGHGICGMARLSKRSFVAVTTFMLAAVAAANLTAPENKVFSNGTRFLRTDKVPELFNRWLGFGITCFFLIPTVIALNNLWLSRPSANPLQNANAVSDARKSDCSERTSPMTGTFESGLSLASLTNADTAPAKEADVENPQDTSEGREEYKFPCH